jgi:hypothetical protein
MPQEYTLWKPASKSLPRDTDLLFAKGAEIAATRAADTGSASPIMAQQLEPEVMPVFVGDFPFYDLIEKVPSNGVSHTFQQQTAFAQSAAPHTISETGSVADESNAYLRKTTNIALAAMRRGVTIKAQLAGAASGRPSNDLMARELKGGLQTIARDMQNEMLRYQESDNTSTTLTAPNGTFDVNGLNGLRYIVQNQAPAENSAIVDIRASWTDQRVLLAFRQVCDAIWDKGGRVDLAVASTRGSRALLQDQMALVRYLKTSEKIAITPGLTVPGVEVDQGVVPVLPVPGPAIGTWTNGTNTFVDIYLVWTETLELPYLGAPEPTIVRIPMGTDGTLRELAIPFVLLGFAAKAPQYLGRISLMVA